MSHVAVILGQLALVMQLTDSSWQLAFSSKHSVVGVPRLAFSSYCSVAFSGLVSAFGFSG